MIEPGSCGSRHLGAWKKSRKHVGGTKKSGSIIPVLTGNVSLDHDPGNTNLRVITPIMEITYECARIAPPA